MSPVVVTFRGQRVVRVEYDVRRDTFHLIGPDDEVVAELPTTAFMQLHNPLIRSLPHGRHRRASSKVHGGPSGQSSGSGQVTRAHIAAAQRAYNARASKGAGAGLTLLPLPLSAGARWLTGNWREEEPAPIPHEGIRAGEITGHRCWLLRGDRLHSVYMDQCVWLPDVPMEGDVRRAHGVHAFKERTDVYEYVYLARVNCMMGWSGSTSDIYVFGTVSLWGEVVEHERGWRAERARVLGLREMTCLEYPANMDRDAALRDLRSAYGLPQP